jgi:hypothetical protein
MLQRRFLRDPISLRYRKYKVTLKNKFEALVAAQTRPVKPVPEAPFNGRYRTGTERGNSSPVNGTENGEIYSVLTAVTGGNHWVSR